MISACEAEIIEFKPPQSNQKTLFVSGIPNEISESEIEERLHNTFTHFGLIFGIVVRGAATPCSDKQDEDVEKNTHLGNSCYALVNFYSARDAGHALASLSGQLFMKGQCLKIKYCSKMNNKQMDKKKDHLYVIRAKELANHYLGFNGWTTEIVKFEPHEVSEMDALEADDNNKERVEFICVLRLKVPEHGIAVEGVGIGDGSWAKNDYAAKGSSICKAKKYAHQRALETAFSKLLVVVLPNGKVFVEVDTRKMAPLDHLAKLDMDNLLEVKDLDEAPPSDEDSDLVIDNTADLDDVNVKVLAQLHNS